MGYFQSVGSSSFKSDSHGNRLFYKWGIFGKGYVLTSKGKEEEIMNFLVLHYKISFISIIVVSASLEAIFAILTGVPLFT